MKHYEYFFFGGGGGGGDVLAWNILLYLILYFLFNLIIITSKISISVRVALKHFSWYQLRKLSIKSHNIFLLIFLLILITWRNYFKQWYIIGVERSYVLKPLTPKISFSNSLHYLPYSSCDVSLENLVLDKLIIPLLIFFCLILYWYCREKFCLGHSWELKG